MVLDVETPTPPDLTNRGLPSDIDPDEFDGIESDLSRAEIEEVLRDGAWEEAFNEWAEYTELTAEEYRTIDESDLFEALDFYWHPVDRRLRFEVPSPPDEWRGDDDLTARVEAELTDLAETVRDLLEDAYGDWSEEGPADPVWTEEMYDEGPPPED